MTNEELQALCDAATPGPWDAKNIPFKIDDIPHDCWDVYYNRDNDGLWFGVADNYDEPTAKFVAAARTELPRLLAENARLRKVEQAYIKIVPFLAVHGLLDYTPGPDMPTLVCSACGVVTNARYNGMCFACAAKDA